MDIPETGFFFDDKRHRYYLDGQSMTGCTTVLGVIAKPALIQWAANQAAAKAFSTGSNDELKKEIAKHKNIGTTEARSISEKFPEFKEARTAHNKKRDDAATKGTDIHKEIEIIILDVIKRNKGFIPEGLKHTAVQVQHFIDWAVKNKVEFLASERKVYSKTLFVAGTYDFKCIVESKIYMGDIKTSSGIYGREPFAQTAAYQKMEEEMTGHKDVDGRLIINLKKTGKFDEEKDVHYSYDYDTDLEMFLSALSLYRIINNY